MIIQMNQIQGLKMGSKAENLSILGEKGYKVPSFFCVNRKIGYTKEEVETYLRENYAQDTLFAVRSSSSVEDGAKSSFAGQFDTYLNVKMDEVWNHINKVASVTSNKSIREYCKQHLCSEDEIQMNVIIQQMIPSERSGVLFTANPQGILNESVVVVGEGTGNLVVDDRIDTTTYYYNNTDEIYYYEQSGTSPLLKEEQLKELICLGKKIRTDLVDIWKEEDSPVECDIEYAIVKDKIYILQVRQITTLKDCNVPIILDNSNIVESYPGITLPLTQSFITEVYYKIFQSLLKRLTKNDPIIDRMDETLQHMVDVSNGRVYYRISNWYDVILLLPFSHKIIPVWQEMLGVENKKVSSHKKESRVGLFTKCKVTLSFFQLLHSCPKQMKELDSFFEEILAYYEAIDLETADNQKLFETYQYLVQMVMEKWDITLVNDMYSFLYTGLFKAKIKKKIENAEEVSKQYLSQISDIESMKPVRALIHLAERAKEEQRVEDLKQIKKHQDYQKYIENCSDCQEEGFITELGQYIDQYGDRNVEELKLESETFRTNPALLMERIIQFAENNTRLDENTAKQENKTKPEEITTKLEENNANKKENNQGVKTLDEDCIQKLGLKSCLEKATLGIKNREKSRLYRGRLYGMMRSLMLQLGKNLKSEGTLEEEKDIFWLFESELEAILSDRQEQVTGMQPIRQIICGRKRQYEMYEALPAYSRLVFAKTVTDKNPVKVGNMTFEAGNGCYRGAACSNGVVEGEVLVVDKPDHTLNTMGKILVTKMTDPGWVFLIADAKGIIAEKGSLLSHTAIISRELQKPAVVNVKHITELLKTGDYVRVDGIKGEVVILNRNK